MAGSDLFIGEMLDNLNAKLDSVMQAMNNQVAELINVKAAVISGVNKISTKAGIDYIKTVQHSAINKTANSVYTDLFTLVPGFVGSARIAFIVAGGSTGTTMKFRYSIDGGSTYMPETAFFPKGDLIDIPISVNSNTSIVKFQVYSNGTVNLDANSIQIKYSLADLVNDGPVSVG